MLSSSISDISVISKYTDQNNMIFLRKESFRGFESFKIPHKGNSKIDSTDYEDGEISFSNRLGKVIENRIDDGSFDFNELASEMNVSKSTLYRRINLNFGLSPNELLYSCRIQIALSLILKDNFNISEIAYKAGFNDPKYFSKCFKNEIGLTPKQYRELLKQYSVYPENQMSNNLFIKKVMEKIEVKISDGNLSIDQFANEMNVSKTTLYRKIKSVTDLTPCEFVRSVRIQRAAKLLTEHWPILEVSYAVGFNDSKYFSKCFKKELGVTPKKYQQSIAV